MDSLSGPASGEEVEVVELERVFHNAAPIDTPVRINAECWTMFISLGIQGKFTTENSEKPLRNIPACKIFS
jgi:hypothetical protein